MPEREPGLVNALIRCVRDDRAAERWFELVRADLGLWVRELDAPFSKGWNGQIESVHVKLKELRHELASLKEGSDDFTLHLGMVSFLPVRIPQQLMELALECGFGIEVSIESP